MSTTAGRPEATTRRVAPYGKMVDVNAIIAEGLVLDIADNRWQLEQDVDLEPVADLAHLLWAVNQGCLGFHVWPNRLPDLEVGGVGRHGEALPEELHRLDDPVGGAVPVAVDVTEAQPLLSPARLSQIHEVLRFDGGERPLRVVHPEPGLHQLLEVVRDGGLGDREILAQLLVGAVAAGVADGLEHGEAPRSGRQR